MLEGLGFGPVAVMLLDALLLLPVLVVLGETLPKELFRVHADRWTVSLAPIARWSRRAFTAVGLVPLLEWMGEGLVRRLRLAPGEVVDARQRVVELLRESRGAVDERQVAMAGRVLDLSRRSVAELMTPWRRVAVLPDGVLPQVVRERLRTRPHACYPVVDASGACVGAVSAIDLLCQPEEGPVALMKPIPVLAFETPALEALRALRQAGAVLAVVEQAGRPVGVIGPPDLLGPVVGRISA
jgi:CBS domain containing-hemolysin-like protein